MPQVKVMRVKSLLETCVEYVSDKMDYWCAHSESDPAYACNLVLACNPFDELPLAILKRISTALRSRKSSIKKKFFEFLLTPQLDSLDLESQEEKDIGDLLYLASNRCHHLKILKLRFHYNVGYYASFFLPKFGKLQVLDISETEAGDRCLHILGTCCKALRQLNVLHCHNVTDAGIKGLCVSVDNIGREDSKLGQCKLIEKLITRGSGITRIGIKLGLDNLPALKFWDEVHVRLLFNIHKATNLPVDFKYSLLHLELREERVSDKPYAFDSLGFGIKLCPSLTKLIIHEVEQLMDSDLLPLISLENLRELIIFGVKDREACGITFHGGVLPLLASIVGTSLQKLKLSHLRGVSIPLIVEFCPSLRSLKLMKNWSYSIHWQERETIRLCTVWTEGYVLKLLEDLCLDCDTDNGAPRPISSYSILSLLFSPSLMNIDIKGCGNLTDDVIQTATAFHQFKNLETLSIFACHSLTKCGIDNLMTDRNPLKKIELINCRGLTRDDKRSWKRQKEQENWQVEFKLDYSDYYQFDDSDSEGESDRTSDSLNDFASDLEDFDFEEEHL